MENLAYSKGFSSIVHCFLIARATFMNRVNLKVLFFLCALSVFYACKVKKKDFDPNNVEWKDITPAWGVPIVNSTMTLADGVDQNKSNLIIEYDKDDDDFITFIYLDTVYSPTGSELLQSFGNNFYAGIYNTLGDDVATAVSNVPAGQKVTFPLLQATVPFVIDSVKSLSELKLKDGILKITANSRVRHNMSLTLTFPNMTSASGTPLSLSVTLNHAPNTQLTSVPLPDVNLDGYTIKTGGVNALTYSISGSVEVLGNDNPPKTNVTSGDDSLNFTLAFENLGYKYIIGDFYPLRVPAIPHGRTDINVFDNVVIGNIRFTRPQVTFTFVNSFGVVPSVELDSAKMYYSYDTTHADAYAQSLLATGDMPIPGITTLKAPTVLNGAESSTFLLDTTNSTIRNVLSGAPYKFEYSVPAVTLSSPGPQAFITDDSQLQIQTEVKIPMEGRVNNIAITDTVKDFSLPKSEYVDYVEFRAGSVNSIPFSIEMQCYFLDSSGFLLDSLVVPPDSKQIVGPGQPLNFADMNHEVIKETTPASYYSTIHVPSERYKKISQSKSMVIIGRMYTLGSDLNPPKSVKFYPWQTVTFKLSVYARLRVDITDPAGITNLDNQ